MVARGNSLSRNPNVCASCSSLNDGMEEEGNPPVETDETGNSPGFSSHPQQIKTQQADSNEILP